MRQKNVESRSEPIFASSRGLHRREFLLLSSSAAIGLAATSIPAKLFGSIAETGLRTALSVGYLDYLPEDSQAFPARGRVVAAESLSSGDPRFGESGALIRLVGFWRPQAVRSAPLSATLLAYYPANGAHDKAPFVAWTYVSDGSQVFATPRALVHAPIGSDGLDLAVMTGRPAPFVESRNHMMFARVVSGNVAEVLPSRDDLASDGSVITLRMNGSGAKLRPGTYFVALGQGSGQKIDWSSIRVADLRSPDYLDRNGGGPLSQVSFLGSQTVEFPYLALSIEADVRPRVRAGTSA